MVVDADCEVGELSSVLYFRARSLYIETHLFNAISLLFDITLRLLRLGLSKRVHFGVLLVGAKPIIVL